MKYTLNQRRATRHTQNGSTMIEVLIAILVMAFGMTAMAGLAAKSTVMEVESAQRARALFIMQDMADRISANRVAAADYVSDTTWGEDDADCDSLTGADLDLCEWNNTMRGSLDRATDGVVDGMTMRGCVTQPDASVPIYVVTVAWQGISSTFAPADECAEDVFGDDTLRKVVRTRVRIADLAS